MKFSIKIEVWKKNDPRSSEEKYFNSDYETDYNKEVALLKELIEKNGTH